MNTLEQLATRIAELHEDLRAEVIVADILAGELNPDDVLTRLTGQLKRPYSRDVQDARVEPYRESREHLVVRLNRDGIYDALPEGIFHQPGTKSAKISVPQMVADYRRRKEEENEARQFFAPFENEFFYQKTLIEAREYQQLTGIHQSKLDQAVINFLGIDPGLPQKFSSRLVRLLPYAYRIAGSLEQTGIVFSMLLEEKVSLSFTAADRAGVAELNLPLGKAVLGEDLTSGDTAFPDHQDVQIIIGPVKKNKLMSYLEGGTGLSCLQTLVNFFIPVEWDIKLHIAISKSNAAFTLNENEADARLSYTTLLQETA